MNHPHGPLGTLTKFQPHMCENERYEATERQSHKLHYRIENIIKLLFIKFIYLIVDVADGTEKDGVVVW